jgi:predicted component of type VI protein secretion system
VELSFGDEFVVGDQLLRVEANPQADDGPDPDPTYFYSSPKWPSSFRIVQVFEGGASGACLVARGNTLQVGSAVGDLIFPDDPLVGEQHCVIEEQAGTVLLSDLGSRTGVFVRIRGSQELLHGDELLVGRTRLVVDLGQ